MANSANVEYVSVEAEGRLNVFFFIFIVSIRSYFRLLYDRHIEQENADEFDSSYFIEK